MCVVLPSCAVNRIRSKFPSSGYTGFKYPPVSTPHDTLYLYMYKCKNHFNEMKGDVGMSLHQKEGNKKNLHQADNPSLHLCFKKWFALFGNGSERQDLVQSNCMLLVQEQRNKK